MPTLANFTTSIIASNRQPLRPWLLVPGAEPWQMALLTAINVASIAAYALVTVATYRVSRNLHPFILFFSEGIANMQSLITFAVAYVGQLLLPQPSAEALARMLVSSPLMYSGQLHYLLIAVNRGVAIFFPLRYDSMWDKRTIVASVWIVWVGSIGLGLTNLIDFYTYLIYRSATFAVTYPSLAIYTAALTWVLLSRVILFFKRRSQVANTPLTLNSSNFATYAHAMDLRVFAYCLVSFLPNCYSMVVKPPLNSLHFQYYAIARPASAGLLLFVMSKVTREQTPGLPLLRKLLQLCRPHAAIVPLQTTTNHRNTQHV